MTRSLRLACSFLVWSVLASCFEEHASMLPDASDMDAQVGHDASARDAAPPGHDAAPLVHHDASLDAGPLFDASLDAALDATFDAAPQEAGEPDASHDAGPITYPALLSRTGLFADFAQETLAPGVRAFEPKYKLWSDGAHKRRWLYLPDGAQIDTSDMDHWVYPVGTKAWKEFSVGDVRVETRLLYKVAENSWLMIAYQWRADRSDADAVPGGVSNANGTPHDIPDIYTCTRCHDNMPDKLLGPSAIQLTHQLGGLDITTLVNEGRLTQAPPQAYVLPGDAKAQAALGYLHANCGHCHNPRSAVYAQLKKSNPKTGGPRLWENVLQLLSVEATEGYASTVGRPNSVLPDLHIIEPGKPDSSELWKRISQRGPGSLQMPPVATEFLDDAGMASVRAWIESLPEVDAGTGDAGSVQGTGGDGG
ncbi:MAG: hypothetical protein QM778_14515 [Myxococcales bacterium]